MTGISFLLFRVAFNEISLETLFGSQVTVGLSALPNEEHPSWQLETILLFLETFLTIHVPGVVDYMLSFMLEFSSLCEILISISFPDVVSFDSINMS